MSLQYYEQLFQSLNMNKAGGHKSPYKVAMLLSVFDGIEAEQIKDNKIYFNEWLRDQFKHYLDKLGTEQDKNNPHLPFFHLKTSGFWFHKTKPGKKDEFAAISRVSGINDIHKYIEYAYLTDELFELLSYDIVRKYLKEALCSNLDFNTATREKLLDVGNGWDWFECEAAVKSYFEMLLLELKGEKFVKTHYIRKLAEQLAKRSEKSVEYKYQNISAILIELGMSYISGYKPAFNYQKQLQNTVLAYIAANPESLKQDYRLSSDAQIRSYSTNTNVLDTNIPERIVLPKVPNRRFLARQINFVQKEANNRRLGEFGEEFVLGFEKQRLSTLGRDDLAKEVVWSSKEEGDGLGYDIRSFSVDEEGKEDELFVEVKTTNSGKYQPFFISDNELAFSNLERERYSLYRVYDYKSSPRLFILPGAVGEHVNLYARSYRASFY
ncbi:DUF3883 domain-containing protein [Aliikangiella sp. G2MR2-5]|uniref:DUF3883 domain-containing protein n=1 Tax=Aliikangiella sp. G2MR2-5 TaxID=2788943 RepID=UPI0018ABEBF9|nr:DUF3883 domain-containing protein [Aliikangiella sp. G2MR2-5]